MYIREIKAQKLKQMDDYVAEIPAIASLESLKLTAPITFLVGENGTGKSTLLEAVAVAYGFNPEGGSLNYRFATAQTHSGLFERLTLVKGVQRPKDGFFLRAESFYNVATYIDEMKLNVGGKSLHEQSHGESFLNLVNHRFRGQGLYLLDEPEAALSPNGSWP